MLLFFKARKVKASSLGLSSISRITLFSILSLLIACEAEVKGCSLIYCALGPNTPAVAIDNALDSCQANPRAFKFVGRVKPLERAEEFVDIGHVEARTVVAD